MTMGTHYEFQEQNKVTIGNPPEAFATETKNSARASMADAHHAAVIILVGAWTAAVTVSIRQANALTGGTTAAIAGKTLAVTAAMANLTQILEVEASEMDVANGYNHIFVRVVAAGAGAYVGTSIVRTPIRYEPASKIT
jgi:hypothetical protein